MVLLLRKRWTATTQRDKGTTSALQEPLFHRYQRPGVPYQDEDGLFADFHANRHTFISNLGKAGVSPKVAQTLARHSDINLTMNVYTHVTPQDQREASAKVSEAIWADS